MMIHPKAKRKKSTFGLGKELQETTCPNLATPLILGEMPAMSNLIASCSSSSSSSSYGNSSSNVFSSPFASLRSPRSLQCQTTGFSKPISLCLAMNKGSSVFGSAGEDQRQYAPAPQPAMSATGLLQKAAQMGVAASNGSLLKGIGIASSSSSSDVSGEWNGRQIEPDGTSLTSGLALGPACDGRSSLKELMLGTPTIFGPKHATLDLLGMGMAAAGDSTVVRKVMT